MAEAPAPTTAVHICNLALARLGVTVEITDIEDPEGKNAIVCARHYPMTRRRLLRGPRVFGFAKRYSKLTAAVGVAPAFGNFSKAFALPNGFLRLLSLGDHTVDADIDKSLYDIVNGYIYTSEVESDGSLLTQWIFDETSVAKWDSIFVNLMRLELARDMAYALTVKSSLVRELDEELRDVRLEAGAVAGQEKPPRRVTRSNWLMARRGRSNPTRHSI